MSPTLLSGLLLLLMGAAPERGAVILEANFNAADALRAGTVVGRGVRLEPSDDGTTCLAVAIPPGANGTAHWRIPIEKKVVESLRGCRVEVSARVRGEDLTKPAQHWNGVKVMLHSDGPSPMWPQAGLPEGSFGWRGARYSTVIPADATAMTLVLGLEETTGRAWFDDVRITVLAPPRPAVDPSTPLPRPEELDRRTDVPRLRGAMIGGGVGADDLRTLAADWGANHVRWQLNWNGFPNGPADTATMERYDAWLEGELKRLDGLLPLCEELGIRVLIDLHSSPGGRGGPDKSCEIFHRAECQAKFLEVWDRIARRYKDAPAVWGYDLINEPSEGTVAAGLMDWPALCRETARRVRAIDPDRAIVIEPGPWGSPAGLDDFEPLEGIPGIVYSVHMYMPMTLTHQGVYETPMGAVYPGTIDGQKWDKERMRLALKPVTDFQRAYRVPIYIGEFSAIRWAPDNSAYRYLKDLIEIFEENGWDWAYHAYREWDGWSVEHGTDKSDREKSPTRTDRETLLREHFARNVRKK
jgi:hypothetical protein